MLQEDLFSSTSDNQTRFDSLLKEVQRIADGVVKEMEYPEGCIGIYENKTKNETNYPLQIRELKRTAPAKNETSKDNVIAEDKNGIRLNYLCTPIVTLAMTKERSKNAGCVVLRLGISAFHAVRVPSSVVIKERWVKNGDAESDVVDGGDSVDDEAADSKTEKTLARYDVFVRLDSAEILPYLEQLMRNRLKSYKSKEPSYGCCHLYRECSDVKRCVSKDKMYATVCSYRKNLESGRIFYGKNKNI